MSNQTLHDLAEDYARGILTKAAYRSSRARLIQGIVAGRIPVKPIDYAPPLRPVADRETTAPTVQRKQDRTQIRSDLTVIGKPETAPNRAATEPPQTAGNKKLPLAFISFGAAAVLLLIVAAVLFYPKPPSTAEKTGAETKTVVTSDAKRSGLAGERLLADFLTAKNWSGESMDNFATSWSNLTHEERSAAARTKRMQRMNDSIYKQFLEEKALASIDSDRALSKQQRLIEFAEAIGISDARLVIE